MSTPILQQKYKEKVVPALTKKLGYKNVYRVPGGLFAWKGANLPLDEVK